MTTKTPEINESVQEVTPTDGGTSQAEAMNSKQNTMHEKMNPLAAHEAVVREVSSWEGVSVHQHRMGGIELRVGRRELGHLHALFADLPFPRPIRDELVAAGQARPHHVLPNSGWVTVPMRTASEVTNVIELFRKNYSRRARR